MSRPALYTQLRRLVRDEFDVGQRRRITTALSAISFWTAVVLPVGYVFVLLDGINGMGEIAQFFGLVGLHILTLIGGRHYRS